MRDDAPAVPASLRPTVCLFTALVVGPALVHAGEPPARAIVVGAEGLLEGGSDHRDPDGAAIGR